MLARTHAHAHNNGAGVYAKPARVLALLAGLRARGTVVRCSEREVWIRVVQLTGMGIHTSICKPCADTMHPTIINICAVHALGGLMLLALDGSPPPSPRRRPSSPLGGVGDWSEQWEGACFCRPPGWSDFWPSAMLI